MEVLDQRVCVGKGYVVCSAYTIYPPASPSTLYIDAFALYCRV
ncbi:hypothetical protein HNR44_001874 [Geomicrobium halophilum]|uniref:Uncharacterized protein n=1 Tax=Geomicrobium halophilum TaxID=549000 RepID=A0A841PRV6_9BACL|nr:hypothetical protein [Geomicrobium halophilum]MBB6449896.1 hypothetical protein [Geomicrobium halophilum]